MRMRTKLKLMTAAFALSGSMALAAVTTDQLVSQFQAEGYNWIEVKRGPTQMKVEAVKGAEKVEVVIDVATGAVLKREVESASSFEQTRNGVQVRERSRDFLRSRDGDDDDSDDDSDDDDDDDDRSGHGGGDDDDDDDDRSGRGGGDDDDDDDDRSGRGGDDRGGDDNGGDRGGSSDD